MIPRLSDQPDSTALQISPQWRLRIYGYAAWLVVLLSLFSQSLMSLVLHAWRNELHSHIVLVPFVSGYLLYHQRDRLPAEWSTSRSGTALLAAVALALLAGRSAWQETLSRNDGLALMTLSFACFVAAGGFLFFGARWMRSAAFPFLFLAFTAPLPDGAVQWLEQGSVLASSDATEMYLRLTGTPYYREGVTFALPGITFWVAQECSGIRSSWVLLITSLLLSHLFLHSTWRRVVLVALVIPLAILRNGFRITTVGLLCVHFGPSMFNSAIHRHGGPFFFVLSLIPLFLLLCWFRRQESRLIPRG